jgi:hypothetical protein
MKNTLYVFFINNFKKKLKWEISKSLFKYATSNWIQYQFQCKVVYFYDIITKNSNIKLWLCCITFETIFAIFSNHLIQ